MQALLDKLGWSQGYYARLIGVTNQTVYRWCKGKPDPVAMRLLETYLRVIGPINGNDKSSNIEESNVTCE